MRNRKDREPRPRVSHSISRVRKIAVGDPLSNFGDLDSLRGYFNVIEK